MYEHTARQPKGYITIVEPGKPTIEADTLQCGHCGGHWRVQPGSGIVRGFCTKCMRPVCGRCGTECVPFEKWLDMVEKNG